MSVLNRDSKRNKKTFLHRKKKKETSKDTITRLAKELESSLKRLANK